jgi:hypothetical protein
MSTPFTGDYANEQRWLENHYHCEDCDRSWDDCWYCEVDNECPSCSVTISPASSELLWVNGDLEPEPAVACD